jgi:hypothetical protein
MQDFKRLWAEGYGGRLPTLKDAKVYSGSDRHVAWYTNVLHFYDTL